MAKREYENYRQKEGFIVAYTLTDRVLILSFLRFFPIAFVRLAKVDHMRSATSKEFFELTPHRLFVWWKYWHWPYSLAMLGHRDKQIYILQTFGGFRIYVRLRTGMHFMLRTLINNAKAYDD